MVPMVRKQIYIQRQQEAILKRLADLRGQSEAEVIRQAIDQQIGGATLPAALDAEAWEEAYEFMLDLQARGPLADQPRDWRREDLYEERMNRYGHHPD
jgi:hypothetical protein